MKIYEKYLEEDAPLSKIKECAKKIIKEHGNKNKPISFSHILDVGQDFHFYKDDLPELQSQIEDMGYEIDYDN
jgi:hypothetical protein